MERDAILVFNFGGQYCHLIARRIRESGVYSHILDPQTSPEELERLAGDMNIKGIVLSGGPSSIYEKGAPKIDRRILDLGIPVLGICYGHQLIAGYLGGKVGRARKKEYGSSLGFITGKKGVLKGLFGKETVWMSHGDTVMRMPGAVEVLAHTDNCPVAAFRHRTRPIFGIQWHAEVAHTKSGKSIIDNFVFGICKAKRTWKVQQSVPAYVRSVEESADGGRAIIALSGGVDSSTAAVIASRALGKRLTAVFVDTGMMREGEAEQINEMARQLKVNLRTVYAGRTFIGALKGIKDPEQKRKIIGREFIRVFEKVALETGAQYLIQGTIYPDRIESGQAKGSSVIKTHHNVGGIPSDIKFKGVIEPLRDLYKDEVRKLSLKLGVPGEIVYRQPFPGPGLAVRIVGEVTDESLRIIRKAEEILSEEIGRSAVRKSLWQYFAVLTDTKSTGVKGDSRAYGSVIAIRAVESAEAMTANFARLPYELLEKVSTRITGEIPEVVRVVYDVTNKPPSTIEWE